MLSLEANGVFSATVTLATTSTNRFPIPHTSLLLHIVSFLDTPVHRGALGHAILHGQSKVHQHMNIYGDSYLWSEDERKALVSTMNQPFTTMLWICRIPRWCQLMFPGPVHHY